MDYESMMQWFEGREPYKLKCIQRQAQYHSTYVGKYTFFYESYPPRYNWNIVESGVKHHIPTYMNVTTKVDERCMIFQDKPAMRSSSVKHCRGQISKCP
jgi:hypothetical protein